MMGAAKRGYSRLLANWVEPLLGGATIVPYPLVGGGQELSRMVQFGPIGAFLGTDVD